jgi:hypothetical protein
LDNIIPFSSGFLWTLALLLGDPDGPFNARAIYISVSLLGILLIGQRE